MDFLCLEFINSQWCDKHKQYKEQLENKEWTNTFYIKWNLPVLDNSAETINTLLNFRSFLFQVTLNLCLKNTISSQDLNKLNEYLKLGISYHKLSAADNHYNLNVVPQTSDVNWAMYQIVLSFTDLITKYQLKYLKKCGNPECDWIFYDDSKSHTRKWCDNTCASLMKVRKYRERKKNSDISV